MGRSASLRSRQLARCAGSRIGMSFRVATRPVQHAACAQKNFRGHTGWVPVRGCPQTPQQSNLKPGRNKCTRLRRHLPLPHAHADRLRIGLRPPVHPKSLIAKVSPAGVVGEHPDRKLERSYLRWILGTISVRRNVLLGGLVPLLMATPSRSSPLSAAPYHVVSAM